MPTRASSSKPPSSAKPPAQAATAKPPSARQAAQANGGKPPSTSAKPPSRRAVPAKQSALAPPVVEPTIKEDEDVQMAEATPNGSVNGDPGYSGSSMSSLKRSRVAEIAVETKRNRRRSTMSSLGAVLRNEIPQPPAPSRPHRACFVFGTGDNGQFGLGPAALAEVTRPKLHAWFEEQIEDGNLSRDGQPGSGGLEIISCGGMHTLAVDEAGRVRTWGINDNAALGRQTTGVEDPSHPGKQIPNEDLETYPYPVQSLVDAGFRAVQVDAGDSVSVAVSDTGKIRAWGSFRSNDGVLGFDGVPGHPTFQISPLALPSLQKVQVVSVSCGNDHVLALTTTGHVYVWGNGQQSQLGRRIIERRKINGLEPERLGLRNITVISTGTFHSFAVSSDGTVWAWGLNTFRQTGISPRRGGDDDMVTMPTQVDALSPEEHGGAKVVQIAGGEHHSLFLFDNGEVWACGRSDANQLGLSEDHPGFAGTLERRKALVDSREARVTAANQKLQQLSTNGGDQEAINAAEDEKLAAEATLKADLDEYVAEPVRICFPPVPENYESPPALPSFAESRSSDNPISHITAGTRHNLAVSQSGHVYSWGLGINAQLGLGPDVESAKTPTLIRGKPMRPYKAVYASAGGQHCVILAQHTPGFNGTAK